MRAIKRKLLDNGLTAIYLELPNALEFRITNSVPVGAMHDPINKNGASHLIEHTVFHGTDKMDRLQFRNTMLALNNSHVKGFGALTSTDKTNFSLSASARNHDNFETICDIMCQLMTAARFPDTSIDKEKLVIENEYFDSVDAYLKYTQTELERAMHTHANPYVSTTGRPETFLTLESDDLKAFMRDTYDAGHMTIYACGPLPADKAFEIMYQKLRHIKNLDKDMLPRYQAEYQAADVRKTRPDTKQDYTSFMFISTAPKNQREQFIHTEAHLHLNNIMSYIIRDQEGCFYNPYYDTWNLDSEQVLTSFNFSSSHSELACAGFIDFFHAMEDHIPIGIIQGSIDSQVEGMSQPNLLQSDTINLVYQLHRKFGYLLDTDEARRVMASVRPEEIQQCARTMLEGLSGVYVQGPTPDRIMPLNEIRLNMGLEPLEIPTPKPQMIASHQPAFQSIPLPF